ncbi:MAG: DUF1330 domain-containing protein [Mesorhizobium sp.]|nr:MAG: DUF1330 domain-containing protein [Mesorhizobium sp.]
MLGVFDQARPGLGRIAEFRYIARGGATKVLEGDWEPHRLVIVEFPDMASLMAWYGSPEYSRLKAIRERCAKTRIIALEGVIPVG